ncbi:CFEM domain-containing protein [Colletotrichum tofieldiae]|uniref:CFEM domain-containing protein n=1 Tax=Colletotrichum tofieldiae TaxID=708197 RepID=A0A166YV78_9PEZI|nr:CFEM domain-containing protein [Colletotrichum tofieldiae]
MTALARFLIRLTCLLGLGSFVRANSGLSLDGIPNCAISCVLENISYSFCAPTNQTCLCHDTVLEAYVQACVMSNCTVKEMLAARNSTQTTCGASPAQHENFMHWFRAVFFALPTIFVVFRIANKSMKLSTWGWDDATIVIAYSIEPGRAEISGL